MFSTAFCLGKFAFLLFSLTGVLVFILIFTRFISFLCNGFRPRTLAL